MMKQSIWEQENSLARTFWQNGRADFPIYDMHAHMGQHNAIFHTCPEADQMVKHAKRIGVKRLCFSHYYSLFDDGGNDLAFEACRRHPDILRMYVGINPNKPEAIRRDLGRFDKWQPFAIGLKFLADYHNVKVTDPAYRYALDFAAERKLPVLNHTWGNSAFDGAEAMLEVIQRYPDVKFILGHCIFGDWSGAERCIKESSGNAFLELTAVPGERGVIEDLVRRVGSGCMLFGTDLPWFDEYQAAGGVLSADISEDDMRNIFYRNAENIFGKEW